MNRNVIKILGIVLMALGIVLFIVHYVGHQDTLFVGRVTLLIGVTVLAASQLRKSNK